MFGYASAASAATVTPFSLPLGYILHTSSAYYFWLSCFKSHSSQYISSHLFVFVSFSCRHTIKALMDGPDAAMGLAVGEL